MKIYIFKKSGNLFISSGYFHFKSFFLNVKRKKFFALKPRKLIPQQFDLRKGNFNQWKTLNEQWNVFFSAIFQQKTRVFKDSISKKSIYASTFEKSGSICNCWCYQIKKVSVASLNSFIKDSRSNSLVVRLLDCESTSRGFKTTGWLKVDSTCNHFEVD